MCLIEKERDSMSWGEAEGQGGADLPLSREADVGLDSTTLRP